MIYRTLRTSFLGVRFFRASNVQHCMVFVYFCANKTLPKMTRIKKDAEPVGTAQLVRMQVRAEYTWHKYNVIEVTGAGKNTPNQDSPLVFMELGEKNPGTLQQFICLPLSAFDQRVVPATKADKFWEDEKVIEA